ncbi:hypothetical protein EV360DRAFT_69642 [Lentinula raphanica]|nr:hypothetical protein EV360DRAFT_69642 [Lentinula raphanica]
MDERRDDPLDDLDTLDTLRVTELSKSSSLSTPLPTSWCCFCCHQASRVSDEGALSMRMGHLMISFKPIPQPTSKRHTKSTHCHRPNALEMKTSEHLEQEITRMQQKVGKILKTKLGGRCLQIHNIEHRASLVILYLSIVSLISFIVSSKTDCYDEPTAPVQEPLESNGQTLQVSAYEDPPQVVNLYIVYSSRNEVLETLSVEHWYASVNNFNGEEEQFEYILVLGGYYHRVAIPFGSKQGRDCK